jgi:glycosyltransferase involved in cell wall biosynthesis
MTINNPDKTEIDEAVTRAMSLTQEEISALSYDDALYLWRNLIFVAERIEIDEESVKDRVKIANRADEIFYIIAAEELNNPPTLSKPLNVFVPTGFDRAWTNPLLARDKGYTPYFLSRATGGRCVFFLCDENDPFPVAEAMPGAEFVRSNEISKQMYLDYIAEHIDEIDILVADDFGTTTPALASFYKIKKPEGKVLFVTDINSFFYRNRGEEDIYKRLHNVLSGDYVYTAASRFCRDLLNTDPRFPAPVYFNSNAYLPDKEASKTEVTPELKENIILTAGSIGTDPKNNMPLIRAFLHIAADFPDWKLYLAGRYDEKGKKKLMNDAFRRLQFDPAVLNRIVFTGMLNKVDLYKLYAKAKIFAITSIAEGGTPNVFSESLANGCFIVCADRLDGREEMSSAFGYNIGIAYAAEQYTRYNENFTFWADFNGEALSLAHTLASVIPHLDTSFFEKHIPKCLAYSAKDFDYKKNSLKLLRLLCDDLL